MTAQTKELLTDLIGARGTYMHRERPNSEGERPDPYEVTVVIRGIFWGEVTRWGSDGPSVIAQVWKAIAVNVETGKVYPSLLLSSIRLEVGEDTAMVCGHGRGRDVGPATPVPEIVHRVELAATRSLREDVRWHNLAQYVSQMGREPHEGEFGRLDKGDVYHVYCVVGAPTGLGMAVRFVSLEEASDAFSDDHFVRVEVFRDEMPDVPSGCVGTLNDVLYCLMPSDLAKWEQERKEEDRKKKEQLHGTPRTQT